MKDTIQLIQISDRSLKLKLDLHAIWLKTNGAHGKQADFSLHDLGRRDLSNMNFTKAICKITRFDYSDLTGTIFDEAELDCAEFGHTILYGTQFNKAKLIFTNFNKAKVDEKCLRSLDNATMENVLFNLSEVR